VNGEAPDETFSDRFVRLTHGLEDADLVKITGLKYSTIRDIKSGKTKSIKLDAALRLCRRLGISPWELQNFPRPIGGESDDPSPALAASLETRFATLEADLIAHVERALQSSQRELEELRSALESLRDALGSVPKSRQSVLDRRRKIEEALSAVLRSQPGSESLTHPDRLGLKKIGRPVAISRLAELLTPTSETE